MIKAHVVANDVETFSRFVVLHLGAQERRWVEEVIAPIRKCKPELVLFSKPEEDIEDGAASCFMRLHKHDIHFG